MGAAINVGEVYAYLVRDLHAGTYSTPGFEHALRNARLIAAVSRAAARGERQRVLGTDRTLRPDESNDPLVSSLRTSGDLFTHILRVVDIRAMVFDHYSEPDVIRMRDAPVPEPHEGEEFIRGRLCRHQSIRLESTLGPERTMPGSSRSAIRHRFECCRCRGANGIECHRLESTQDSDMGQCSALDDRGEGPRLTKLLIIDACRDRPFFELGEKHATRAVRIYETTQQAEIRLQGPCESKKLFQPARALR
jgi:hypothetical protein